MRVEERRQLGLAIFLLLPTVFWLTAVKKTEVLESPKLLSLFAIMKSTPEKPVLIGSLVAGIIIACLLIWALEHFLKSPFGGAAFKTFLRGTRIVTPGELSSKTKEKLPQIEIAGIPMPTKAEPLHLLVQGATGTGKSVIFRSAVFSGMKRGDRFIITDPNADMMAKFYRPGDVILNPYDERSVGWSFFNEIRNDYDFERYALSLVPRGENAEAEEWASYARLLLAETARKLYLNGKASVEQLFHWTTIADPENLKSFLTGTAAESLFVGADRALASARFVLSAKLPAHRKMPTGDFSLRDWLDNPDGRNLFITWREDQRTALRPIISAWVDVLCTSILSLEEDPNRRIWMSLDELDSLDKLASLEAALTKGRKHGLRVIAGIQSTAQLDKTYGVHEAQTLRSCFRSLAVLGGAHTDHKTCEDMSRSIGSHEVVRDRISRTSGNDRSSKNNTEETKEERVVTASEIASMPDLTAYLLFSGMQEVARVPYEVQPFKNRVSRFEERVA